MTWTKTGRKESAGIIFLCPAIRPTAGAYGKTVGHMTVCVCAHVGVCVSECATESEGGRASHGSHHLTFTHTAGHRLLLCVGLRCEEININ